LQAALWLAERPSVVGITLMVLPTVIVFTSGVVYPCPAGSGGSG